MESEKKNQVLKTLCLLLEKNKDHILEANKTDFKNCSQSDSSLVDRLKVDEKKIKTMIQSLEEVLELDDPEGKLIYSHTHKNGIRIENKTIAFGKILIIYESRPDVTIEAAAIAFKSGSKIFLKGGKEAKESNMFLVKLWQEALIKNGLEKDFVSYLDITREETQVMIKNNSLGVDLIIPRGGEGLINFIKQNTDIPLIISGRGNNFIYIDRESNPEMACEIIINGKKRPSVCNALDKVLIHKDIKNKESFVVKLGEELRKKGIEVIASNEVATIDTKMNSNYDETIWKEEFLAPKIFLSFVEDIDTAVKVINDNAGGHSASIVSNNKLNAEKFQLRVDCAAVYHNASTRFTDGGQFGLGAEIAISTQKLHFRGPIGLEQLITNKWFIYGNGQIRE